jgi:hypothetical protein
MLLPQEEAEQLTPDERMELAVLVIELWDQAYGIISVKGHVVVVELGDKTRHEVVLSGKK